MTHLCDVNVFVALAVGAHAKHETARSRFEDLARPDVTVFCRATQNSFLRLLTQPIAPGYRPISNGEALSVFQALMSDDLVGWAAEPHGLDLLWPEFAATDAAAPKRWMDAYLAAFAVASGARLVSLDHGFRQFETKGLDLLSLGE